MPKGIIPGAGPGGHSRTELIPRRTLCARRRRRPAVASTRDCLPDPGLHAAHHLFINGSRRLSGFREQVHTAGHGSAAASARPRLHYWRRETAAAAGLGGAPPGLCRWCPAPTRLRTRSSAWKPAVSGVYMMASRVYAALTNPLLCRYLFLAVGVPLVRWSSLVVERRVMLYTSSTTLCIGDLS